MAYATSIVSDVLAYPYYALCSWLAVRALRSRARLDSRSPSSSSAGGYFIRQKQFTSLLLAFVLAAAGLWLTGRASRDPPQLVEGGQDRRARPRVRRPAPLQPRRPAAHPPVAVHEPVLQEPPGRPGPPGRRLVHDRDERAVVIGGLTSLRLPDRRGEPSIAPTSPGPRRRSALSPSTPRSRRPSSRPSSRRSGRSAT